MCVDTSEDPLGTVRSFPVTAVPRYFVANLTRSRHFSLLPYVIFGLFLTFSFISTVGQNVFPFSVLVCVLLDSQRPLVQARGCPDSGLLGHSLHPFGPILLPRSSYNVLAPAVRYSLFLVFGATSVRSLLEIPRHGVSCHHGTESLGAREPLLTEGLRRYRPGTEPPDTCLPNMLHWGAHCSWS
jgi:hypothetical protein